MENNLKLEKQIESLVSTIRLLLSGVLVCIGLYGEYLVVYVGPRIKYMFATSGVDLPALSVFLFNRPFLIGGFILLAITTPIALAYSKKESNWTILLLAVSILFIYFFNKVIWYALAAPFLQMIQDLSG